MRIFTCFSSIEGYFRILHRKMAARLKRAVGRPRELFMHCDFEASFRPGCFPLR